MSAHDDLVRSLLVERYKPWPSSEEPDAAEAQLAAALAHEKRRSRRRQPRRGRRDDDTIAYRRQS